MESREYWPLLTCGFSCFLCTHTPSSEIQYHTDVAFKDFTMKVWNICSRYCESSRKGNDGRACVCWEGSFSAWPWTIGVLLVTWELEKKKRGRPSDLKEGASTYICCVPGQWSKYLKMKTEEWRDHLFGLLWKLRILVHR